MPRRPLNHFNPHEREARDGRRTASRFFSRHFNPHEREARDCSFLSFKYFRHDFNPHEREARDFKPLREVKLVGILIHTSVKLVTKLYNRFNARAVF